MRKSTLYILCFLLANCNMALATKTYYYDQNFKGVASKEFCYYYRIVSSTKDFGNKTRLFDSQDHLLSESGFLKIDKFDDGKSILDGTYQSYYLNGKIHVKAFFVNNHPIRHCLIEGGGLLFPKNTHNTDSSALRATFLHPLKF